MASCSDTFGLYIGDLHPDVNEAILLDIFSNIGHVNLVSVCRDKNTKKSRGYAFVYFEHQEDAKEALKQLNFEPILGKPCRIMWEDKERTFIENDSGNVYIKNIDKSVDNKTLFKMFSPFGPIISSKVATDENGESLCFGFVQFENEQDGKKAIEKMHGKLFNKKRLFVCKFKRQEERLGRDIPNKPKEESSRAAYADERRYERDSVRSRFERLEIMPNRGEQYERVKHESRRRCFNRLRQRSRSVPRYPYRGYEAASYEGDEDFDEDAIVNNLILEVARSEHPSEADLIVKLIREKCNGDKLYLLVGSSALLEYEVEKAYTKIKSLESPRWF